MFFRSLILTGCLACLTTATANEPESKVQQAYQVLFVGNSLTQGNDLPKLVKQAAARRGMAVNTAMVAKGGYAIVDHWAEGRVQRLVRTTRFDFVVIQQGPSSQLDGYEMLINGGADYARLCQENGCRLAYFMVWPSIARFHTFPGVIRNYTAGAEANNALLIPVGQVWKDHIESTGDYSFYGSDGFHPSRAGSEKAAEVIVDALFEPQGCGCIEPLQ